MLTIGSVTCPPKEVSLMSEKESYIPDKAHDVMENFKPAPFGEVSKRLGELSRKTLAEAQQWAKQEHQSKKAGG